MNVYIYAADIYCEDCGKAIGKELFGEGDDFAHFAGGSDDGPKGPYPDGRICSGSNPKGRGSGRPLG